MARQSKEPLRELTSEERRQLEKLTRSRSEVAEVVTRAKSLIAVADGAGFAAGARAAGRKSGYGVGKLVARFNCDGMGALHSKPSYGHRVTYTTDLRSRVLAEFRRAPDRELDGTVIWSLTTLQRAVRKQPGLEKISRDTISNVLHEAGMTWQRDRTWCETGTAVRKRKHGTTIVVDPDAEAKKT
jgi:transposase